MRRFGKLLIATLVPVLALTGCGQNIQVFHPQGPVAKQELDLILWSFALMFLVVLAVFILFFYVMIKYRAKPENEGYEPPEISGNRKLETIWTIIPIIVVIALAIPTVATTYRLQKPPKNASKDPLVINVTSVDWKWLFSYPKQGIETVNYVVIPAGQPVKFEQNAIGPMNSFWVPELGGMEMDMPGRRLGLWLQANKPGDYLGRSANFSGKGFAHMTFHVISKNPNQFNQWAQQVKSTKSPLTKAEYKTLLKPGTTGRHTYSTNQPPPKMEHHSITVQ
ncbi:cytochrome aa3 quinol oxidase subunit II [Alicyclobacillus sp. SO9]|uniref:cytochrome aa3 quinol oxidase subunit II n=1 Tax=Alicyclobacillus sp. SO9 TaxID=2665646 RepID=UPI0018E80539|nr:cytochrome aa3 quinol oxidase subunit II [Alicyclobacillus sp. SO9]QQE81062.1 cytochrome aa3 quinol oxidase subunit II [Alicyclobacillus sp. SO9]